MKLLVSWIFDHIATHAIPEIAWLTEKLRCSSAEIESTTASPAVSKSLHCAQIIYADKKTITAQLINTHQKFTFDRITAGIAPEWILRPNRASYLLLAPDEHAYRPCTLEAIGIESTKPLGPIVDPEALEQIMKPDFIIEIENKSLTHRPDLWGHRGFAREIATLTSTALTDDEYVDTSIPVRQYTQTAEQPSPISCTIDTKCCSRFSYSLLQQENTHERSLLITYRLACVGIKSSNLLVDLTNYVMLDIGQPMHAYDYSMIAGKQLFIGSMPDQTIEMTDGTIVKTTDDDCIIADQNGALSLAGIKGGLRASITPQTKLILIEAATFNASAIRTSSRIHKIRTESSIRFEKCLDPYQTLTAIDRYIQLANKYLGSHEIPTRFALGDLPTPNSIQVAHAYLEKRSGTMLAQSTIIDILKRLGFGVQATGNALSTTYDILIPSWRATKDVQAQEDILEEVLRIYGYENIIPNVPLRETRPVNTHAPRAIRALKNFFVQTAAMHELQSHALYDNQFMHKYKLPITSNVHVLEPVSQNMTTLVATLVPALLKCIEINAHDYKHIRMFELNPVWLTDQKTGTPIERQSLAGIFFDQHEASFYTFKALLESFFVTWGLQIRYEKPQSAFVWWADQYKCIHIMHNDKHIGTFASISPALLTPIAQGQACAFELDGHYLLEYKRAPLKAKPLRRYPAPTIDISMLVDQQVQAQTIVEQLYHVDQTVMHAELIDLFEKPEWDRVRSLTVRITLYDPTGTLTKQTIDQVCAHAKHMLADRFGATVR